MSSVKADGIIGCVAVHHENVMVLHVRVSKGTLQSPAAAQCVQKKVKLV